MLETWCSSLPARTVRTRKLWHTTTQGGWPHARMEFKFWTDSQRTTTTTTGGRSGSEFQQPLRQPVPDRPVVPSRSRSRRSSRPELAASAFSCQFLSAGQAGVRCGVQNKQDKWSQQIHVSSCSECPLSACAQRASPLNDCHVGRKCDPVVLKELQNCWPWVTQLFCSALGWSWMGSYL